MQIRTWHLGSLLLAATFQSPAASAPSQGFHLSLDVPVVCKIRHEGRAPSNAQSTDLGRIVQYCNAPNGYTVAVDYAPGQLRGSVLAIDDRLIVLNGSGHQEILREAGPRVTSSLVKLDGASGKRESAPIQFSIEPI